MTYSGILKNAAGAPVTTSTNITFRLYTTSSGGTPVWFETVSVTPGADGWFSAALGTTTALVPTMPATMGQDLYLSLQVGTDTEFTQRARVTPSGSALAVDWSGVQGKPTCATGQFLTLDTTTDSLVCLTPAGGAGGGVTSVSAAAGTPITVATGTTTPVLSMPAASAAGSGYLSSGDWSTFSAKAPIANPTFSGVVNAPTVNANSFVGALTGNVTGNATTATTAVTAQVASTVAAGAIKPSNLNTSTAGGPAFGQVPSSGGAGGAATDAFTWVTPVTPPSTGACVAPQVLTWNGSALSCVSLTASASVPAYASVTAAGAGTGALMSTAASVTFTLAAAGKVLLLADVNFWGGGPACTGIARLTIDGVGDDTTLGWVSVPAVTSGNNSGSYATSKLVTSMAAGSHTVILQWATGAALCSSAMNPHVNAIVLN
jgi:hypothetical protein